MGKHLKREYLFGWGKFVIGVGLQGRLWLN
jgi:hypothetical protein